MSENEPIGRESIVKYRIQPKYLSPKIEVIEITRETEASVYIKNNFGGETREAKFTCWHEYYSSWESAHAALLYHAEMNIKTARRDLELANAKYGNIKGMKKP